MMKLITGVPGAGKTLLAMKFVEEEIKKGRDVFTNIDGCCYPGVQDMPDDFDWRNLPDGSAVFYDEAHQTFKGTGKPGLSNDPIINQMDEHRHRGFDLYFITQFPTKVHHEIRSMVDEHYHLLRQFGAPSATLYKWPEAANVSDRDARQVADTSIFVYPKHLYKYYKSASTHTAKVKIPAKIKMLACVIGLIGLFVGTRVFESGGFASFAEAEPVAVASASAQAEPRRADTLSSPVAVVPLQGCISSQTECRCFSADGQPVDLEDAICRSYLTGPLPRSIRLDSKS